MLPTLIESVMQQTSYDYELIVVDGGSMDDTINILESYGNRLRYISEPDNGIYDAMNKGVKMAEGEWVYFIGADDSLYDKYVIEHLEAYFNSNADLLLCDIMSSKNGRCTSKFSWQTFWHNTIHHQGCIYRRSILLNHPYDTSLKIVADYDLNLFIWKNNFRIIHTGILFANHALEGVSAQPHLLNYREEIEVRNRYIKNPITRVFLTGISYMKMVYKRIVICCR